MTSHAGATTSAAPSSPRAVNPATATMSPEPRLAAAAELQISESVSPWSRVRSASVEALREQRRTGDEPEVPAVPEREQGDEQERAAVGWRDRRQDRGRSADDQAGRARPAGSRSGRSAGPRSATGRTCRSVTADDQADGGEVVAVLRHVERGHRHDQAPSPPGRRRGPAMAVGTCGRRRMRSSGTLITARSGSSTPERVGQHVRIGSQKAERQQRRGTDEHHGQEEGAGERWKPDRLADVAGPADQVGSDDRPERRAPDHQPDRRRPTRATGRGRPRHTATAGSSCCRTRSGPIPTRSSGNDRVTTATVATIAPVTPTTYPRLSPRSPPVTDHPAGQQRCPEGRADDGRGAGRAAPDGRPGEVLRDDRQHGHGGDVTRAPERHAGHQGSQRPASKASQDAGLERGRSRLSHDSPPPPRTGRRRWRAASARACGPGRAGDRAKRPRRQRSAPVTWPRSVDAGCTGSPCRVEQAPGWTSSASRC